MLLKVIQYTVTVNKMMGGLRKRDPGSQDAIFTQLLANVVQRKTDNQGLVVVVQSRTDLQRVVEVLAD